MDMFVLCVACLTAFVNCLVKKCAICLGMVVILLLNVMEVFSVGGGALLDRPLPTNAQRRSGMSGNTLNCKETITYNQT